MIPKRLHYCWFGETTKPDLVQFCVRSWQEHCPEYEIIEWNEDNFSVESFPITAVAYKRRKFAFVSDFVRAFALYNHGGIYLDADVEVRHSLDRFLCHTAFTGFEETTIPFTAVWGSVRNHLLARMILDYYATADPVRVIGIPNTRFITQILRRHFNVDPDRDELQHGAEGLVVYPSNFFCVNIPEHYAVHHFANSWFDKQITPRYADLVLASFYTNSLRELELKGVVLRKTTSDRKKLKIYGSAIWRAALRILNRRMKKYLRTLIDFVHVGATPAVDSPPESGNGHRISPRS